MCGIVGLIWKEPERMVSPMALRPMLDAVAYRGPDDEGLYVTGPVALGHRRLAILDLSVAGHQPMVSHDGRYIIVYNGEIYNYRELRDELRQHGARFRSQTDTEVLLEAYRVWGTACVHHFNGMWAFVIYDTVDKTCFLSRDRFGIKPLYYLNRADVFAFASEIKGILAAFQDERQVNIPFVHYFLPSGAFDDGPETFFQNIFSLPPAHSALYEVASGLFKTWEYWDVDFAACHNKWARGKSTKELVETFWELLNSSIDLHLRSDVPVGTCLSGGVDSSAIVCLASQRVSHPIHTFSGLYEDSDCNEKEYVDAVNAHVPTCPAPIWPEPHGDLISDLTHITWHQDEPSAGPGLYTQFHVMKRAQQNVKVLLDGQGGDELYAGYLPYFMPHIDDLLAQGGIRNRWKAWLLAGQIYYHWGATWGNQALARLDTRKFLRALRTYLLPTLGTIGHGPEPPFFHPDLVERVTGQEIVRHRPAKCIPQLENTLYWHLRQQSIPALLHYEDRNSMAFSIEARVPYLDFRIVEFAMGLGAQYKIRGSWTKWILRQAASRVMPPKVAWRRSKLGYPTPFARWIRQGADRAAIEEILFAKSFFDRGLVSEETVRFYWQQHQDGIQDRSWLLYRYITLELWYRHFIDRWHPAPVTTPVMQ